MPEAKLRVAGSILRVSVLKICSGIFLPENARTVCELAGLLTWNITGGLPIRLSARQWQERAGMVLISLQLRVQLRSFT